ncbi:MAG: translation initiation factor IF-2 [Desulfatiglandaceae bacterium]
MAKVRVYELARELNIDGKKLVEMLAGGGLDVKNTLSTLDETAAMKAREMVSKNVVSEVIEEKRITRRVIRRRKKVKVDEQQADVEASPETVPETPAEEEPVKTDEAAISAVQQESEAPAPEALDQKTATETEPTSLPPEEKSAKISTSEPAVPEIEEELPAAGETPVEAAREDNSFIEAVPEHKVEPKAEPAEGKKAKSKKSKKKFDQPARIISKPVQVPQVPETPPELTAETTLEPTPAAEPETKVGAIPVKGGATVAEEPGARSKKLKQVKKKKERRKIDTEADSAHVSAKHRKKEIYERADLYQGRPVRSRAGKGTKSKDAGKKSGHTEITVPRAIKRRLKVQGNVTVAELARAMGVKAAELIKKLMMMGTMVTINQELDIETASLIADEYGYELEQESFEEKGLIPDTEDAEENLKPRPPVVTIMGHVDHGKTSLLDYIRKSNITEGEFGGITQHIGAYYVESEDGNIVFLDTPGHEAFTAMRARGAKVTDLIVLVVAADDGVMPQTKEAVNHARAAGIPIVVAVNKIDKPEADPDKVKRELAELDLIPEDWGGDTIFGHISAKTGEGVDEFLSLILLQAEILELKANPDRPARGNIIEAKLDRSRGPLATVLISNGTLKQGDYFVCGEHYGRVRAMQDYKGRRMGSAGPSVPVEITGISGVPLAGDEFAAVPDEKTAKEVMENRKARGRKPEAAKKGLTSLDDLFERMKEGEIKELNLILRADVQGSLEALSDSLLKMSTEDVKVKIIHSATGGITEGDIMLASASDAIIIGYNVRANPRVADIAEKENVDIRHYDVIYNVLKDIRMAMTGLLEPIFEERVIGRAEIREVFRVPKVGAVAGCQVTNGHAERNSKARLLRDDVVVFDGKVTSLKRFKEDVKEVQTGYECGVGLENFNDIKEGDVIEFYLMEKTAAEL